MKVTYIVGRPELCGGVKVVFQHAQLLHERGHTVTVIGDGDRPPWFAYAGGYHDYGRSPPRLPAQELVMATFWTTIPLAESLALGPVVHFCQGYEGGLHHLTAARPEIEAVYRRRLPAFVVAPHLAELLRTRFARDAVVVPPPLDPLFRPAPRLGPRARPWVFVPGVFEAEVKDVRTALHAVLELRRRGCDCRVVRLSALPACPEESALLVADRYLCRVAPEEVARILRRCDLVLSPSLDLDGFGLPLLESLASRVPAVAADTPAARFITAGGAALVPAGDAGAFAAAALDLLRSPLRWHAARRAARRAVGRFRREEIGRLLADGVEWARRRAAA